MGLVKGTCTPATATGVQHRPCTYVGLQLGRNRATWSAPTASTSRRCATGTRRCTNVRLQQGCDRCTDVGVQLQQMHLYWQLGCLSGGARTEPPWAAEGHAHSRRPRGMCVWKVIQKQEYSRRPQKGTHTFVSLGRRARMLTPASILTRMRVRTPVIAAPGLQKGEQYAALLPPLCAQPPGTAEPVPQRGKHAGCTDSVCNVCEPL